MDVWKRFMVKAHKGVPRRPLTEPDPEADTSEAREMRLFYAELIEKLVEERNLASGIVPGADATENGESAGQN